MGLLRNIADKLKGKKQEAIEIDYNPQEEPEGLDVMMWICTIRSRESAT